MQNTRRFKSNAIEPNSVFYLASFDPVQQAYDGNRYLVSQLIISNRFTKCLAGKVQVDGV